MIVECNAPTNSPINAESLLYTNNSRLFFFENLNKQQYGAPLHSLHVLPQEKAVSFDPVVRKLDNIQIFLVIFLRDQVEYLLQMQSPGDGILHKVLIFQTSNITHWLKFNLTKENDTKCSGPLVFP